MKTYLFRLSMSLCILCMVIFATGHPAAVEAAPKPSNTPKPANTPRPTNTLRPTNTPKSTKTPRFTATASNTPTASPTPTSTFTAPHTPTYTPTATATATDTPTNTPIVLAETTTVVTDNATTIPGGPAPVKFGGTIIFTATVSSANGTPNGTVRWTLSHDAPYTSFPEYNSRLDAGSGIVGACQGDIPVVNGVATCAVTPGWWYLDGDEPLPFYWGIRATATFTPAAGSPFAGSSGSDATNKITTGDRIWPYCGFDDDGKCNPFVVVSIQPFASIPFWVASAGDGAYNTVDSLGRNLVFYWCAGVGPNDCPHTSSTPLSSGIISSGYTGIELLAVCPEGIGFYNLGMPQYWDGSFECNYPGVVVILKNEYQTGGLTPTPILP